MPTLLFYILCFLTGQYIASPALYSIHPVLITVVIYVFSSLCLLAGIVLNVCSFAFDIFVISKCPFKHCGYLYTYNITENMTNITHLFQSSPPSIVQFDDWQKVVFTTATVSGVLSYFFMIHVLYCQYSCFNKCKDRMPTMGSVCCLIAKEPQHHTKLRASDNGDPLKYVINPFFDEEYTVDENDLTNPNIKLRSALITPEQSGYFQFIFWLNFLIYTAGVVLFFTLSAGRIISDGSALEVIDIVGLVAQFFSQFCAILSCFIFSKVAYAVSNRCLDLTKCIFPMVNIKKTQSGSEIETEKWIALKGKFFEEEERKDVSHLMILTKMDQKYAKLVKKSLGPYGKWFTIHWVLYTVTAFMSIAYVADLIEMELYTNEKCRYETKVDCRLALSYSICFALEHCILFLYPCFRAASVTRARSSMIKSVSKAEWRDVPPGEKSEFVAYLKDQNCNFKVSILCAKLSFGFNMAYISIFVGILGVILKIST